MTITLPHMSFALLVALSLHGGIAFWLTLPPAPERQELPEQTLRVSLLAVVAETPAVASPVTPPPPQPKIKPPVAPKPEPKLKPTPKPIPEPKLVPIPEPISQPEPLPVENPPEIVKAPPPIQEPPPVERNPLPLPLPLSAAATAKYEQLLVAWLEKYKKYPRRAQRMRIEGEARLRISINRAGQTQNITLEQSSGNRLLDKAALAMGKQANPFPPMPDNDPRQALEFTVPVVFALR